MRALRDQGFAESDIYVFKNDDYHIQYVPFGFIIPSRSLYLHYRDVVFSVSRHINVIENPPPSSEPKPSPRRLAIQVRKMLNYLFHTLKYEFVWVIENDLLLSPDSVAYFTAMSEVLRVDPSLFCVSGHADNSFRSTSADPSNFLRGNHFMAPDWMMSRQIYTTVVDPHWPAFDSYFGLQHWDHFFNVVVR